MASFFKWKPSKAQKEAFKNQMNEIENFLNEHPEISASATRDSYYFNINGVDYRISNHSVESSPYHAYQENGKKRLDDVIYIHASKTRIIDIYTDLTNGVRLDGHGVRI